jgi:signal transduction histidine kinase/CheY-like chemotaxis protein
VSRSLYFQILFVTLAFALMVISSGKFVSNMLMSYLERDAENILTQTQIRIMNELREPETLMILIVKDVREIIMDGGGADGVLAYFNRFSAELSQKEHGFIFDGFHGYFEAFGNALIPPPVWTVPEDYDATNRPWYKTAVEANGKIALTPIYLSSRSGEYQINVTCRIFDDEGRPLGVIAMDVLLDNITKFVSDTRLVEGGYGFLADEKFELVAHHETNFITRHMDEISDGFMQIVRMMQQGESFIKVQGYNYQGIDSILYCKRIDNDWYLGIMTPKNAYYHDLRALMLFLGVLGFVLMLTVNIILIRIDTVKSRLDKAFREQYVQLDIRLKQQSLMTSISRNFLSSEDMDTLTTKAFGMVGEFMGIDQILMYAATDSETSFICRNEWINPKSGLPTRIDEVLTLNQTVLDIIKRLKKEKRYYVTSDDPNVKKVIDPYRTSFFTYILTFVFLGDDLYAVVDFSQGKDGSRWDQDHINMAAYITNILTGAVNKRSVELQLIAAKEAAEQSNRSKGLFLANMSHEIRTPMNAILGISEIQLQSTTLPPDVEEALNQIYDSGNLLLNIINDILDFSKIEAGKMEIVPVKYDVPSLLNDTAQLNRLRYESKPIEFMLDVDENTPLELYGDELRIKQILNNLLSNAFKYTDEGKVGLSVCAEPGEDKEIVSLVFRVSDTGQGMREDQITRLFDAYSRFNMEANRTVTGAGLGMNIVKRLIEMMDGEIMVESEIGKGSTITVRLPQKSVGPAVCGAEFVDNLRNFRFRSIPISKKAQIIHEYMPYGSVLVVDDVVSNIYVIRGLLRPYGLRIETATSGIEAIDKIKDNNVYDIVFMDHMMPVMDGMKATKIIRDMGYTRTIIAFTANAIVGQSDIFLANGFDGFISKPIDSRELDAVLKTFIRDKQPPEVIEAVRRGQHQKEQETNDTSEVEKYFVLDAEKAIKVIEEIYPKLHTSDTEVVDSYITAVHGMKSALANIDETKLSGVALSLERAGRERNFTVITEESPAFINALRVLIDQYKPVYNDETTEISGDDMVYLRNKLLDIKLACEKFDITAARNALEDLRRKTWPRHVNETLDEISVHLLHSAFKKAAAAAENMTKT